MNEFYFLVLLCVPSSIAQKNQSQVTKRLLKKSIQLGQFHSFSFSEYRTISIKKQHVHQSHGQSGSHCMGWPGTVRSERNTT